MFNSISLKITHRTHTTHTYTSHTHTHAHTHIYKGENGRAFRELIEKRIEKWLEPPPPKQKKALRIPDNKPKRRRGGKRCVCVCV